MTDTPHLFALDCMRCGSTITTPRADGLWQDGDLLKCEDRAAVNQVSADDDDVYFNYWTCRHGKGGDEPCGLCDLDDAAQDSTVEGAP